ncbi:hypothetical protein I3843_06G152800 [Carya illinoinensis]|nr:hypothetical protein I3843_06G152800 [Carya illinoinensis]
MLSNLFSLVFPFTSTTSFNFTSFNSHDPNISYEGSAGVNSTGVIQLTGNQVQKFSMGRATYSIPMHLWDNASTNLADFTTHFSFVIAATPPNKTAYADGLAFFLAPVDSQIPDSNYSGGTLGLTSIALALNSTKNDFVAVEFDIFRNVWDPQGEHVGIDIKSMESVANASWWSNISISGRHTWGGPNTWISYNSTSYNLSVGYTGLENNVTVWQFLSFNVDLRKHLPEKVTFGFSAATGSFTAVHTICSWDFSSSLEIDDTKTNKKLGLDVGLGAGGLFLVAGRDKEDDRAFAEYMDGEFQKGTRSKSFSFRELARATNNFRDEDKLGQGGFGSVYKGFLRDSNIFVAIKRVSKGSMQGMKEYAAEVKIISLASSLLYLHEGWEQCVVHRDIKSSNIMLDSNFNAKLGDFGLARLVDHAKGSQTTVLAGTFGYMAPECVTTCKASKESDVYSFRIVTLEIATGRKPINPKAPEDQVVLVEWVWELYGKGEVLGAADPRLGGDFDGEQMERLIIVGMWCAHPNRNLRPSIKKAIDVFNFKAPLPILPSSIPESTYLPPIVNRSSMSLLKSDAAIGFERGETRYSIHSQNTNSSQITSSSIAKA